MTMDFAKEVLEVLLKVVLIPAIPILVSYISDAFKEWAGSKAVEIENDTIEGYLRDITDIITQAVTCTTQTYVESLKAQGKFDKEAQEVAFNQTKEIVLKLLAEDAKDFIREMYGDIDPWLNTKIEQEVNKAKKFDLIAVA